MQDREFNPWGVIPFGVSDSTLSALPVRATKQINNYTGVIHFFFFFYRVIAVRMCLVFFFGAGGEKNGYTVKIHFYYTEVP